MCTSITCNLLISLRIFHDIVMRPFVGEWVSPSHFTLLIRERLQFLPNHFQTSYVNYGWWEENSIDFGSHGQRIRSTLALSVSDLVDTIQSTVFAQSLSYFPCTLWMMRTVTLLILGHGVTGQGQLWHFVYKTLWTRYRLQLLPNHFQT